MRKLLTLAALLVTPLPAGPAELPHILPLRERAQLRDQWLGLRLGRVVPELMKRHGVDMWIVVAREYNEDPIFPTMAPSTWLAARRRTLLVFHLPEDGPLERLAVARYDIGEFFRKAWDPESQPDQWKRLAEVVAERDPNRIALNFSRDFALADGITWSERTALEAALAPRHRERLVSGQELAVGWLETRIPEELEVYPSICRLAHGIIREGFSEAAIQPGFTTTDDLEWWYRQRVLQLGLDTWFHPSVSIQRADDEEAERSFASRPSARVIRRGDLLHVDFGITYLGLNTDTQQHAYVLRAGESEAPAGLREALARGNRLQDLLTAEFVTGRSGNQILRAALDRASREGLTASIYTHPLGFHGHGAGPTIGLWDRQEGVPGAGDYPLYPSTVFSIELNVTVSIPEWYGKEVRIMLEEDALFTGSEVRYLDGRQLELLLVR